MSDLKCYFHGAVLGDDPLARQDGVVSFAVPDIGTIFRSRWNGSLLECQYAALLSLLRFIEVNKKLLAGKNIEIFSDASVVIYQLAKDAFILKGIKPYYQLVQAYKSKFPFRVHWLPKKDNPACHGLGDTPPLKPSIKINYDVKKSGNIDRRGGVLPM